MLIKSPSVYLLAILCAIIVPPAQATVQRAFIKSTGSDSNTAFNCDVTHPCRYFFTAVTVVSPDGEVVVLDSGNYGLITLTQSISLTAPPGVYAGLSVPSGSSGVTIAASGVNVVLRGLTINGQGGNFGINMTAGTTLSIENCLISNFSGLGQYGVFVNAAAAVRMVNTIVRDNTIGINLQSGATADISESKFLGNDKGIWAQSTSSPYTSVTISDTIVAAGGTGIEAISSGTGKSRVSMIRSSVTSNLTGVASSSSSSASPTPASITLSDSMVTGNVIGFSQGTGGTLTSLSNNTITDNGSNIGTLGTIPLQ